MSVHAIERFSSVKLALLSASIFIVLGVINAPASLLSPVLRANAPGLLYQEVTGTIWRGSFRGVIADNLYLGNISYRFRPQSIFLGEVSLDVDAKGGAARGDGRLAYAPLSRQAIIRNSTFEFDLSAIREFSLFGIPYGGEVHVNIDRALLFVTKGCSRIDGTVWTDVLDASSRDFAGEGLAISGPVQCIDKNVMIDLAGANALGRTHITIEVSPDLNYQLKARVAPDRSEHGIALQQFGFENAEDGLVYNAIGALKGTGI